MHTYLLRVGLYEKALAELAAPPASARASMAAGTARAIVRRDAAAAPLAAAEPPGQAHDEAVDDADDTVVLEEESLEPDAAATSAAAPPPLTHDYDTSRRTGGVVPTASPMVHWRSHVGTAVAAAAAAAAAADSGSDLLEDSKYASYRYHHQHMSGADAMSRAGTNVLMDNGLALLVPSHMMVGLIEGWVVDGCCKG
jgi:hypothetical protein